MNNKQNSFKLFSRTLVLLVFSAISAFSILPIVDAFEKLSADSTVHQALPINFKLSEDNQTLEEESFEEQADQFISNFTLISVRYDCSRNHCIESSLPIISGSQDIRIPPPKNI